MSHHEGTTTVRGKIADIFAHRFTVEGQKGKVLADLGKHNLKTIEIKQGDEVELIGEQKPSELKVHKMAINGAEVTLGKKPKKPKHSFHEESDRDETVDMDAVLATAKNENILLIGEPHRKPLHFELLGTTPAGELVELHIELDGKLRKAKPVENNDEKWAKELSVA